MEQSGAIFVDVDPGREQSAELRAAGLSHDVVVNGTRQEQRDADAALRGHDERLDHLGLGDEVGIGDADRALG